MVANDDTQVGGRTQPAVANSQKKTRVWKKFLGPKSVSTLLQWIMKTASLGLLEVMVVRANAI